MKLLGEPRTTEVVIEETYRKYRGRVYYYWRIQGQKNWNIQLTSYSEIPYFKG